MYACLHCIKMGIEGLLPLVGEMMKTAHVQGSSFTTGAPIRPDVMAIDANSLIYWAYETFLESDAVQHEESGRICSLTPDDIMTRITTLTISGLRNIVNSIEPLNLIIALDGVPPLAKIMNQRDRRMFDSGNRDLRDAEGKVIFSMSWLSPDSPLSQKLDQALSRSDVCGHRMTVYSGPGVPGEGEHKIFPILQSLCRENKKSVGVPAPKKIVLFGNDNDFYVLSCLFLSTFDMYMPEVYLYNDRETRKVLGVQTGIYTAESNDSIKVNNINLFYHAIDHEKYTVCGKNKQEKILHFTYLLSLLGNDFVPRIDLVDRTQTQTRMNTHELIQAICRGSASAMPFIDLHPIEPRKSDAKAGKTDAKSDAKAGKSDAKAAKTDAKTDAGAKDAKYVQLPIFYDTDALEYVSIITDKKGVLDHFVKIQEEINRSISRIAPNVDQDILITERLHALASFNGRPQAANSVAIAASATYIQMLDNILSYYVSSTCVVPKTVECKFVTTMPKQYYGYGMSPPSYIYLTVGAQIAYVSSVPEGLARYNKTCTTLATDSISPVDFTVAPEPSTFVGSEFQASLIFPARTKDATSTAFRKSATCIPKLFPKLSPVNANANVNTNLLPSIFIALFYEHFYRYFREKCGDEKREIRDSVSVYETSESSADKGNYVPDALAA